MNRQRPRIVIIDEYAEGREIVHALAELLGEVAVMTASDLPIRSMPDIDIHECRIVNPVEKPYWQRNSGKGKRKKW